MSIKVLRTSASRSKGITLIEILMALGLLAILLSFAVPTVSGVASKAELTSAMENVQFSIQTARKTARMTEKPVSMDISVSGPEATQTITFSSPGRSAAPTGLQIQNFSLPAGIILVSDRESFVFDKRGLVEIPGQIVLVSSADEEVSSTLYVD